MTTVYSKGDVSAKVPRHGYVITDMWAAMLGPMAVHRLLLLKIFSENCALSGANFVVGRTTPMAYLHQWLTEKNLQQMSSMLPRSSTKGWDTKHATAATAIHLFSVCILENRTLDIHHCSCISPNQGTIAVAEAAKGSRASIFPAVVQIDQRPWRAYLLPLCKEALINTSSLLNRQYTGKYYTLHLCSTWWIFCMGIKIPPHWRHSRLCKSQSHVIIAVL